MKYKNAAEVLPPELIGQIQEYIQGAFLYIPKKEKQAHRAVTEYRLELDGEQVGGCEVHYLADATAYLRWIYVSGELVGRGIGTQCMGALKQFLYGKGVIRFDTDTAHDNHTAQHYYEKNGFTREGITRSYYQDLTLQ